MSSPRLGPALGALALFFCPRPALADADEASVHGHAAAGIGFAGDHAAGDAIARTFLLSSGLAFTYATSDYFAYETTLELARTQARFENVTEDVETGDLARRLYLFRASMGVRARLGVRYIPTLGIAAGYQHRWLLDGDLLDPDTGTVLAKSPGKGAGDLVITVGPGFDYRIDRHWILGLRAQVTHAFSPGGPAFTSLEAALCLGYYWYPRRFWET